MNSEPCVRFGMRISPKISEKPAERRNSRPPKATALTDSTYQFIAVVFPAALNEGRWLLRQRPSGCGVPLRLEWRGGGRIDRVGPGNFFCRGPETGGCLACVC